MLQYADSRNLILHLLKCDDLGDRIIKFSKMTSELKNKTIPLNLHNIFYAIWQSPAGGPYPRIGKMVDTTRVSVPHFFRKPSCELVESNLGNSRRVILYTQGLTCEETEKKKAELYGRGG